MSLFTGQVLESKDFERLSPWKTERMSNSRQGGERPSNGQLVHKSSIYTLCHRQFGRAEESAQSWRKDSTVQRHADTLMQGATGNSNMNRISAAGQRYRPGRQLDYCFYKMMTSFLEGLLSIATGTPWTRKQRSRASRLLEGHHRGR